MSFRLVQALVYAAFLAILACGIGWVWTRIAGAPRANYLFGMSLIWSLRGGLLALGVGLVVGLYHLYLYIFTDRRPLGFFATTDKDGDADGPPEDR